MTAFLIVVTLLVAWRGITWLRRQRRRAWEQMLGNPPLQHRPRSRCRFGDRRRRREGTEVAGTLVAMLAAGGHDPVAHLGAGVVLQPGETPWAQARARLATWDTHAAQVSRRRVRWWGRRLDSVVRQVTASGWQDNGEVDWLITSLRLVGRTQSGSELISIWWSGLAGLQVDLETDTIRLNGNNGWRGHLTGPGVAPIAVGAVAACHGPQALSVHQVSPAFAGQPLTPSRPEHRSRSRSNRVIRCPICGRTGDCREGTGDDPGSGSPRLASATPAGLPPCLPPSRPPGPPGRDHRQRGDRHAHCYSGSDLPPSRDRPSRPAMRRR